MKKLVNFGPWILNPEDIVSAINNSISNKCENSITVRLKNDKELTLNTSSKEVCDEVFSNLSSEICYMDFDLLNQVKNNMSWSIKRIRDEVVSLKIEVKKLMNQYKKLKDKEV